MLPESIVHSCFVPIVLAEGKESNLDHRAEEQPIIERRLCAPRRFQGRDHLTFHPGIEWMPEGVRCPQKRLGQKCRIDERLAFLGEWSHIGRRGVGDGIERPQGKEGPGRRVGFTEFQPG